MRRALPILAALTLTTCAADGKHLSPAAAAAIERSAGALCTGLLPLATPYLPQGFGALDAFACTGLDAALGAALAPVTATPAATTPVTGSAPWGPGSARPLCAVRVGATKALLGLAVCDARLTAGHEMGAAR